MLDFIKNKYKQEFLYLFFGAATTLINIVCFALLYELLNVSNIISTVLAWIVSVLFAFVTNKWIVFKSNKKRFAEIVKEIALFFVCRILTGILDVAVMYVAVDIFKGNGVIWKVISNIIVIIVNYFASKIFVFKNS